MSGWHPAVPLESQLYACHSNLPTPAKCELIYFLICTMKFNIDEELGMSQLATAAKNI